MLRSQQQIPQLKTQTSSRNVITKKSFLSKALTLRNLKQPSSPGISITVPKSRNIPWPLKKKETAHLDNEDLPQTEQKIQKDRIVITKLSKNSDIEFGIISQNTKVLKPLEPFFKAIRKDQNQSNFRISPKNALLYKEDGIDLLLSKFKRPERDQSNHSMDVKRNDVDDFCKDQVDAIRIPKPKVRGPFHRRRSCVCSWCGDAPALEKAIQNHPGIPTTICQKHCEEIKPVIEQAQYTPSNSSRHSSKRRMKASTPMRTPKKSTFGTFLQAFMSLEGTPRSSARSSQTMTALEIPETQPIGVRMPRSSNISSLGQVEEEAPNSHNAFRSITLEEGSSGSSTPKNTLTLLNKKSPMISLTWRDAPEIYTSVKKSERVMTSEDKNQVESQGQVKTEANIFKVKRVRTKRFKTQLHLACNIQTIKELYTGGVCVTPQNDRTSPQPPSYRESANGGGLSARRRVVCSSISGGLELPKAPLISIEKSTPRHVRTKTETSPIVGQVVSKQGLESLKNKSKVKKVKAESQTNINLKTIQTLKNYYQSQAVKVTSSPKRKVAVKKEWVPPTCQVEQYMITV